VPNRRSLEELTGAATERNKHVVEFAGFLTREDDAAVYIADPQGTWVISRADVLALGEWEGSETVAPQLLAQSGRPVRITVRDGATIHEIRPWQVRRSPSGGSDPRQVVEQIFSLGGDVPGGDVGSIGDSQLAELERAFARRLGFPATPGARGADWAAMRRSSSSGTLVLADGY
jgi:hypothetical protein